MPSFEICDGIDNDCDQEVDERCRPCDEGRGCATGQFCVEGQCFFEPGTCEAPILIETFGAWRGSNAMAEAQHACTNNMDDVTGRAAEVVYQLAPPRLGTVCINTDGSALDTVVYVRADDCGAVDAQLACNDDLNGWASWLEMELEEGVDYFLFVDGFGQDQTNGYSLNILEGPCDWPEGPLDADLDFVVDEIDNCPEISNMDQRDHDQDGVGDVCDEDCLENLVACGIMEPNCAADEDCLPGGTCVDSLCQGGAGTCEHPIVLDDFGTYEGSTVGGEMGHDGSCGGGGSQELVYLFTAPQRGPICIDVIGENSDPLVYVREGVCADADRELACNDDGGRNLNARLELDVQGGIDYYLIVDAFGQPAGTSHELVLSSGACP